VRLACEHWGNTFRIALSDLGADALTIRFEDFLREPESGLRLILDRIGLSPQDDLLPQPTHRMPIGSASREKWYPLRPTVNDRYLAEIPKAACEIIEAEVGDIAKRFDYTRPR